MNKPQWQIEIEERRTKARKLVGDLCTGKAVWMMSIPAQPKTDPDLVLAASLDDIPHLLAALDKMREALKIFACNEHPKILTDGSLPSCCVATQALNFDPTQQTKQEGGE